MARMVDLDQPVFVPIVDETKGGMVYEVRMTLGEFFERFLPDFTPRVIEMSDYTGSDKDEDREADDE